MKNQNFFVKCINNCGCVLIEKDNNIVYGMQHFNAVLIFIFIFYLFWKIISDKINFNNISLNNNYIPLNQEFNKLEYEFKDEYKQVLI